MRCFFMFKGLPGCGKSTAAKKLQAINLDPCHIVERDDIRDYFGFLGQAFSKENEQKVTDEQERIMHEIMSTGDDDVISSDTNFNPKCEKLYRELCKKYDYEFIVKDMSDIPIEVCIYQDSLRTGAKHVGEKVIRDMARRYNIGPYKEKEKTPPVPITDPISHDRNLPSCVIVDIDGTIAKMVNRTAYDESKVYSDSPRTEVITVIKSLYFCYHNLTEHFRIIFLSGRTDKCYDDTMRWLIDVAGFDPAVFKFQLLMRKSGDYRKDSIVKNELFDSNIRSKYNVVGVFDDRHQVINECWLPKGFTVFDVGDGSIF